MRPTGQWDPAIEQLFANNSNRYQHYIQRVRLDERSNFHVGTNFKGGLYKKLQAIKENGEKNKRGEPANQRVTHGGGACSRGDTWRSGSGGRSQAATWRHGFGGARVR